MFIAVSTSPNFSHVLNSFNYFQVVNTKEEIFALMKKGEESRHTGKTKMNERSSRSHTIFRFQRISTYPDLLGSVGSI